MIITRKTQCYSQEQLEAYEIYKSDILIDERIDFCENVFTCPDCVHYRKVTGKESVGHGGAIMHCSRLANRHGNVGGYAIELGICYKGHMFEIAQVHPGFQLF